MKKIYFSLLLLLFTFTNVFSQLEGTTWRLAPMAQALAVGPTQGDFSWWSNTADDVAARACFFDDQCVFEADGTFRNVQDGETWLEAWQGVAADGCGTPIAPHDGSNPATWTFDEAAGDGPLNPLIPDPPTDAVSLSTFFNGSFNGEVMTGGGFTLLEQACPYESLA